MCPWPFHHGMGDCADCVALDAQYGENLDKYLVEMSERKKAKREA